MIVPSLTTLALIGDIGGGELLVVFAAILLLFGGKGLPSIARSLGRTSERLRKASQEFKDQVMNADGDVRRELSEAADDTDVGADTASAKPADASSAPAAPARPTPEMTPKEQEPRDLAG